MRGLRKLLTVFLVFGDIVLRRRPVKVKDFVRKYLGPFEVVEAKWDTVVLQWLATPPNGAHKVVYSHVPEIKSYIEPDANHNPDHVICSFTGFKG